MLFNGLNSLPTSSGGKGGSFSEVAEVFILGKGPVAIKKVSVVDQGLTASGYQTIYGHVHDDTPSNTHFLQLFMSSHDKSLEITEDHQSPKFCSFTMIRNTFYWFRMDSIWPTLQIESN